MKFLLSLSFLLFAAASSINASSFFADGSTPPPVIDVHHAPLQFGVPYYMKPSPFMHSLSGGLRLGGTSAFDPCAKMIEHTARTDRGTPVVFSSPVQNVTGNITIETELIISFYNLTRPNDESCSGSNSTTWVAGVAGILAVGGVKVTNVFRLSLGWIDNPYFFLIPVVPSVKHDFVVGYESGRAKFLAVMETKGRPDMVFWFRKAKRTEEDEGDKPVIIQMPRKMSV